MYKYTNLCIYMHKYMYFHSFVFMIRTQKLIWNRGSGSPQAVHLPSEAFRAGEGVRVQGLGPKPLAHQVVNLSPPKPLPGGSGSQPSWFRAGKGGERIKGSGWAGNSKGIG